MKWVFGLINFVAALMCGSFTYWWQSGLPGIDNREAAILGLGAFVVVFIAMSSSRSNSDPS
ncbi:MAG: hypothetical protein AAFZ91_01435 [Pseudomonadota bacterium]